MRLIQSLIQLFPSVTSAGTYGPIFSFCVILFLISRKVRYTVSLTYAIGSLIAFFAGSFYCCLDSMRVRLGNVIGVTGGYLLLLLALIQYLLEKRTRSKTIIEQKSSKSPQY